MNTASSPCTQSPTSRGESSAAGGAPDAISSASPSCENAPSASSSSKLRNLLTARKTALQIRPDEVLEIVIAQDLELTILRDELFTLNHHLQACREQIAAASEVLSTVCDNPFACEQAG